MRQVATERALADLERLRGRLVVSCQAREENPLHGPLFMAAMAKAAVLGGAAGIRADGVADVAAIRAAIGPDYPIIGISRSRPRTARSSSRRAPSRRGRSSRRAPVSSRSTERPGRDRVENRCATWSPRFMRRAAPRWQTLARSTTRAMPSTAASTRSERRSVATRLTARRLEDPDFPLLERLARECPVPAFAEGRIWTPEEARQALELGAAFVVVGTAITNPTAITARFVAAIAPESTDARGGTLSRADVEELMPKAYDRYFDRLGELMTALATEGPQIEAAAKLMADCIADGGIVHVFGSGHSHMMAEEVFHRAGGLFAFNAMLDINLTSFGTLKAGMVERTEGYAKVILASFDVRPGEVVVIVSNSGINPVPIELAIEAGRTRRQDDRHHLRRKLRSAKSRHSSGKKLAEVADLTVDSHVPVGDAILSLDGLTAPVAASSTALGAALMNAIVAQTAEELLAAGHQPPVIVSMNVPGGDEHNAALTEQYRPRLRLLRG